MERYSNYQKPSQEKPTFNAEVFSDEHEKMVMLRAYEKAQEILESKSLKPEQFSDTYSEKLLTKCEEYVTNCEKNFAEKDESESFAIRVEVFGNTLEALIYDQINNNEIFGGDVRSVMTAKYDDYFAGIDSVIERRDEDGSAHVGCALDATFGSPEKKMNEICKGIKAGVLNDVIFYESPFGDPPQFHGKLQGVPKMVIGMDSKHLAQLSELWIQGDEEGLKKNQLFLMLLRQIKQQAEVYEIVAERARKPEIANRYKQVNNSISKLYKELSEKMEVTMLDSEVSNDNVNQGIRKQLNELINVK